jgi:polyphosphate glucokinase
VNVLVIDVGGTHVKVLASGRRMPREFLSGPTLSATQMATGVKQLASDWNYDVVAIGYPGPVLRDRPVAEPHNLGRGWVSFDYARALGCPVKMINDAAMQALGAYRGGKMLFLGLGTGLGSTLVVEGIPEAMELGHLPYRKKTYEDYVGLRGLEKFGKKKWRKYVKDVVERLVAALEPEDVVIGGGNAVLLDELPAGARRGDNADAFVGGFRLWAADRIHRKSAKSSRMRDHKRKGRRA